MAEESITLISKNYAESNFIERGEYTKLESKVNGNTTSISDLGNTVNTVKGDVDDLKPEVATLEQSVAGNTQAITGLEQSVAGKQDKLTASTGINLDGSTISVDTATTVGDSNLPVTASAVNTKLGDYATTTQLNDKQDNVGLYIGSDGSVTVDNGITQAGAPWNNFFEGPTEFANGVVIQSKKPVLDVTSSDGSVTVTRSSDGYGVDLKANGGGGETKAKAWYCSFIGRTASECTFYNLNPADEPEIESIKEYNTEVALITFKEEKSMSEVNEWLIFRAKMIMGMNPIYDTHFGQYVPTAICPWPEDKPWPESN